MYYHQQANARESTGDFDVFGSVFANYQLADDQHHPFKI